MRLQRHLVRTFFVLSIVGFVLINFNLFLQIGIIPYSSNKQVIANEQSDLVVKEILKNVANEDIVNKVNVFRTNNTDFVAISNKQQMISTTANNQLISLNSSALFQFVLNSNQNFKVLNAKEFHLSKYNLVIVIQIHKRLDYLAHLITSLSKSKYINETLVIFSHDFISEDANQLIAKIKFCQALQVFYPYSMQIFPNKFPGSDPNDCPRDATKEIALKSKCNNAEHPDKYGHYREATFCQTKHHWFWKANHIFDHLPLTKDHSGPVLFLEEDHYVADDFIHVLLGMYNQAPNLCPDCSIFTLGNYDKNPVFSALSNKVSLSEWISSKHNMGMSFNRLVWQRIKACAQSFCAFDDYNWDWTLQHVSTTCIPGRLSVMTMRSPRVFHIGECGIHHKGTNCEAIDKVSQIEALLSSNHHLLYPERLDLFDTQRLPSQVPKPNGGWGDIRDHNLCLSFLNTAVKR